MKIVIGAMKSKLGRMGMPGGAARSAKAAPHSDSEGESLDDLFAGNNSKDGKEGSPEEEAGESADEEAAEGADLGEVSDEDLLKEMRKRGLSPAGTQGKDRTMHSGSGDEDEEMDA